MITHLFKLIWNKKKQNFLLMLEILISFMVMFAVFTAAVYYYRNYNKPIGFDYENVWSFKYDDPEGMRDADSIAAFNHTIKKMIAAMPQVESVSFSDINTPFGDATMFTSIFFNQAPAQTEIYRVDDDYQRLLNIPLLKGRWFSKEDDIGKEKSVVINEALQESLFGGSDAVGRVIDYQGNGALKMRIVGVIGEVKDKGDLQPPRNGFYTRMDTSNQRDYGAMLIKVRPGTSAVFERSLYKSLSNAIRNTSIDIWHLDDRRRIVTLQMLGPILILLIVAGFFVINVSLGLFGVLWYNISKRKSEIGLRRAVGASGNAISRQMVAEALVLSTISLIVGAFFAVQFPLMNVFNIAAGTYLIALLLAVLFIYLLVIVCAFYPGRQAAGIYPAAALHED
jgi:putative ABC transport system permease protein